MVRCTDNSLYTGITKNVARRITEHNSGGPLASRYTRARRPVKLMYEEKWTTQSKAAQREHEIKRLKKKAKEALIQRSGK